VEFLPRVCHRRSGRGLHGEKNAFSIAGEHAFLGTDLYGGDLGLGGSEFNLGGAEEVLGGHDGGDGLKKNWKPSQK